MNKKTKTIILIIVLLLILSFTLFQQIYLKISNIENEKSFFYPFSKNGYFSINYIHSYDRTPVTEKFGIDKSFNIIPVEVIYSADTYDLRDSRYPNSKIDLNDKDIRLYDIKLSKYDHFPKIFINIKNYEPQYLTIKSDITNFKDFSFLNYGEKGDLIKIEVIEKNLISYLIERSF